MGQNGHFGVFPAFRAVVDWKGAKGPKRKKRKNRTFPANHSNVTDRPESFLNNSIVIEVDKPPMSPLSGMSEKSDILDKEDKMAKWVEKRWDETYHIELREFGQEVREVLIITKQYGSRKAKLIRQTRTEQA